MTKFYFLERDYTEGDMIKPFEYHQSLELLLDGKNSELQKIPYLGANNCDYITSGMNVFSKAFKEFIDSMNIANVEFIPIIISQKDKSEKEFYLLKFICFEDCIEYEKSDIVIIQGLIRKMNKLKMKENFNNLFFQIKGLKLRIAVNEEMKRTIEREKFQGIKFTEIE